MTEQLVYDTLKIVWSSFTRLIIFSSFGWHERAIGVSQWPMSGLEFPVLIHFYLNRQLQLSKFDELMLPVTVQSCSWFLLSHLLELFRSLNYQNPQGYLKKILILFWCWNKLIFKEYDSLMNLLAIVYMHELFIPLKHSKFFANESEIDFAGLAEYRCKLTTLTLNNGYFSGAEI